MGPRQGTWTRSFNPFRSDAESRWPTWAGIYEPLLISNRATGAFTPWLASAYSWSADNLTFRVTTRPGVRWSDGQPFTARDVAFTFDLMRRFPALDHDAVWLFLESVTARDAQTVEFKLKRPYTPGAVYLGEQAIVPEHKWKDVAQPATFDDPSPVATGPFVAVKRFEPTVYELGRNPTYWQPGKPGGGRAAGASLSQQRRDRARARRQRGGLGVPLLPGHREGVGGRRIPPVISTGIPTPGPLSSSTSTRAASRSTTAMSARP